MTTLVVAAAFILGVLRLRWLLRGAPAVAPPGDIEGVEIADADKGLDE